ncbi:MAG TPA: xanthine dehydrogenase family protein subunit M [Ktedonobacterales bacterium]|nr:xanthine dehydrogenase family protein subunit M [Ktedonobacterales bacterium]
MYSTDFTYHAPTTLAEAISLLQGSDDAKLLAGGQSLIPLLKLRFTEVGTLVDLSKLSHLRAITEGGDSVTIGAMTPYFQVIDSHVVQRRCPLLVQAIKQVGDPQVRARGTVGGSLAHADPAGDLPAVAQALNAEITAQGPNGSRTMAAKDFFVDMLTTALQPAEVLTWVRFRTTDRAHTGTAYVKHRHPASGYAVVGVAAVVSLNDDGTCREAQIGITGAGAHAVRASGVEQALAGKALDDAALAAASASAADGIELLGDTYASKDYRAHLARVLTKRALAEAVQTARSR